MTVVARDQRGNFVVAWIEKLDHTEPLMGEAKAAWIAIKKAAEEEFERIILEGDQLNAIERLRNKLAASHWSIKAVMEDSLYLAKSFVNVSFSFVLREQYPCQPSSLAGCTFELDWANSYL